jgi:hypothetical protein
VTADFLFERLLSARGRLLAVSLLLFFYERAGVRIEQLDVFGNKVAIANPENVSSALWVAWVYFLVRHAQYLNDIPDKGVATAYARKLMALVMKYAIRVQESRYALPQGWSRGSTVMLFRWPSKNAVNMPDAQCWEVTLSGHVILTEMRKRVSFRSQREQLLNRVLLVLGARLQWLQFLAGAYVVCCTRVALEYFLPFAVAAAPVVQVAWEALMPEVRPYAAFWEWYGERKKQVKEGGVMADFLVANESQRLADYADVQAVDDDPPDFRATSHDGKMIGIELTELVSDEAIRANVKARDQVNATLPSEVSPQDRAMALLQASKYKDWTRSEVITAVEERLRSKDGKNYEGYSEVHVIVHTDEPTVPADEYVPWLENHEFPEMKQVTRGFVLFAPVAGLCRVAVLRFKR